mmetsp:Transcript_58686/g.143524  ORF Transcript_58686/g.143524 Transcript_58686/m.143524 type:complete len:569 (-) Transcript_58686:315-2021(-)
MSNISSYQTVSTFADDDGNSDIIVVSSSTEDGDSAATTNRRRKMYLAGGLGLLVVLVGAVKMYNSNSPSSSSSPLTMKVVKGGDVLLPDGKHDESADHLVGKFFDQKVDHFDPNNNDTFPNQYMSFEKFFKGPGHPIFFILGGEDPLTNLITPNVYYYMSEYFGAAALGVEHRYFGDSLPVKDFTNEDLKKLMTPEQAVEDFAYAIKWYREKLGCSPDRSSKDYCPLITVAGSYPGFLSAMMRLTHPEIVDISYATSAPLNLYSHGVDDKTYFDYVTEVADKAVPGCAAAVKTTMTEFHDWAVDTTDGLTLDQKKSMVQICPLGVPQYIYDDKNPIEMWWTEVDEIISAQFAESNMGYYPPGPDTELEKKCRIFLEEDDSMIEKIGNALMLRSQWQELGCYDMHSELPPGRDARISASDWSGMGEGIKAYMWEFLSCQLLPALTQSDESMFYPRKWSYEWVGAHCKRRFDMDIEPDRLKNYFGFEDLTGVEHLLFVNNLNDGWSRASITVPPPNSGIEVINVVDGAHCSDFRGSPHYTGDTPAMREAHKQIRNTIEKWLHEINEERLA